MAYNPGAVPNLSIPVHVVPHYSIPDKDGETSGPAPGPGGGGTTLSPLLFRGKSDRNSRDNRSNR